MIPGFYSTHAPKNNKKNYICQIILESIFKMERNDKLVYVFDKNIPLVTVASDLDQNVSLLEVDENVVADTLAVIHESFVNIIPILHPHRRARYVSITSSEKRDTERVAQVEKIAY